MENQIFGVDTGLILLWLMGSLAIIMFYIIKAEMDKEDQKKDED